MSQYGHLSHSSEWGNRSRERQCGGDWVLPEGSPLQAQKWPICSYYAICHLKFPHAWVSGTFKFMWLIFTKHDRCRGLRFSFIDKHQCFVVFLCLQHLVCFAPAGFLTRTYSLWSVCWRQGGVSQATGLCKLDKGRDVWMCADVSTGATGGIWKQERVNNTADKNGKLEEIWRVCTSVGTVSCMQKGKTMPAQPLQVANVFIQPDEILNKN